MRIEIFKRRGRFRWRMRAPNGKTAVQGAGSYARSDLAAEAILRVMRAMNLDIAHGPGVEVVLLPGKAMGRIRDRNGVRLLKR